MVLVDSVPRQVWQCQHRLGSVLAPMRRGKHASTPLLLPRIGHEGARLVGFQQRGSNNMASVLAVVGSGVDALRCGIVHSRVAL